MYLIGARCDLPDHRQSVALAVYKRYRTTLALTPARPARYAAAAAVAASGADADGPRGAEADGDGAARDVNTADVPPEQLRAAEALAAERAQAVVDAVERAIAAGTVAVPGVMLRRPGGAGAAAAAAAASAVAAAAAAAPSASESGGEAAGMAMAAAQAKKAEAKRAIENLFTRGGLASKGIGGAKSRWLQVIKVRGSGAAKSARGGGC